MLSTIRRRTVFAYGMVLGLTAFQTNADERLVNSDLMPPAPQTSGRVTVTNPNNCLVPSVSKAGCFRFTARVCNGNNLGLGAVSNNLESRTASLTGIGNSLTSRTEDGPNPARPGSRGSIQNFGNADALSDGQLDPSECVDIDYEIALGTLNPFTFLVDFWQRTLVGQDCGTYDVSDPNPANWTFGAPCTDVEITTGVAADCPYGTFPMTRLEWDEDTQQQSVYKFCATYQACETLWYDDTSSQPSCTAYDPANPPSIDTTCYFCCVTDDCNAPPSGAIVPVSGTLWAP